MFEINPNDFITPKEKVLYNIFELLTKLVPYEKEEPKEVPKVESNIPCKTCGGFHENKGQVMVCARKHKKGEK